MQGGTRVYCLYRVSLSKQADHIRVDGQTQADIPMQKEACRKYCQDHGWEIVNSFTEPGVSGYKNSIFERDAIADILSEAKEGNYDILLVYALDRLSRRDYELPILMQRLNQAGISVWTTQEGEIPYKNSTDHLLLYMQGWKAYGESERISQRIATVQSQIVMRGEYRGGAVPYGYRLVESGEISKQGRKRHLLCIHEPEAAIVRIIFSKIADEGYTMYELTRYLSEMKMPDDVRKLTWRSATLHDMLRNRIYIGQQRFGSEYSLPFSRMQIIDPSIFIRTQEIINHTRKALKGKRGTYDPPPQYHDLIFCGHCGSHLVYNHAFDKHKDGVCAIRYYYRCYNKERFTNPCTGASTFSGKQIDADVREKTTALISFFLSAPKDSLIMNSAELARTESLVQRENLKKQLAELDDQLEVLQKRLTDTLRLYGIETTTELQIVYNDIRTKRNCVFHALQNLKPTHCELDYLIKTKERSLEKILSECEQWNQKSWKEAEGMTPRFFERIDVFRGYQLKYHIVSEVKQFLPVTMLCENHYDFLPVSNGTTLSTQKPYQ
ncbi:MAG: recombinase family protein [Lachnospiraceae bacterium]|nr:recombinase family protein [Lachnospiraceae bacterium]